MKEIWKDIPGLEGYYIVSNTGLIKSVDRIVKRSNNHNTSDWNYKGKFIKPRLSSWGYLQVSLYGINKTQPYVHIIVAKAFIGDIPDGYEVNHKDGNKQNNYYQNLEIVTKAENNSHAYSIGLKKSNIGKTNRSKLSNEDVVFIRDNSHLSGVELARKFNVTPTSISKIRLFKQKSNGH